MHANEIRRAFEESRVDQWAALPKGSTYDALKQMASEGLLMVATQVSARGAFKSVYRASQRGRAELKSSVRRALKARLRSFPTTLYGALIFLEVLPKDEVLDLIEDQLADLEREIDQWRDSERAQREAGTLSESARLMFENARQHVEADCRLLQSLRVLTRADARLAS